MAPIYTRIAVAVAVAIGVGQAIHLGDDQDDIHVRHMKLDTEDNKPKTVKKRTTKSAEEPTALAANGTNATSLVENHKPKTTKSAEERKVKAGEEDKKESKVGEDKKKPKSKEGKEDKKDGKAAKKETKEGAKAKKAGKTKGGYECMELSLGIATGYSKIAIENSYWMAKGDYFAELKAKMGSYAKEPTEESCADAGYAKDATDATVGSPGNVATLKADIKKANDGKDIEDSYTFWMA